MAQILVDELLPESLIHQLKARARRNGRSLEAEVRKILRRAVAGDRKGLPIQMAPIVLSVPVDLLLDSRFDAPADRKSRVRTDASL